MHAQTHTYVQENTYFARYWSRKRSIFKLTEYVSTFPPQWDEGTCSYIGKSGLHIHAYTRGCINDLDTGSRNGLTLA